VPLPLTARRVVETKKHGWVDAEPLAGQLQLFDAKRAKIVDGSDGRMRFAGLAVRGAGKGYANALLTEVHQHAAMKELVVWMREDDQQRCAA
jgi:hypothetical protein